MKTILLLITIAITLCLGERTRYDDYSVVRLFGINSTDVQSFEDLNIDVWAAQDSGDSWADLMLHQNQLSHFLELYPNHKIVLENVQTELDRHYEENEKAKANSVGLSAWDYFPPYAEIPPWIQEQVRNYPGVARHIQLGRTYDGDIIEGLSLGTSSKPLFFIHCTIHAREWITTTTCCYIIDQLLTSDDDELLLDFHWVIVPVLNIDGYKWSHSNSRLWRKNRQPNSGSTCVGTDLNRNYANGWGGGGADTSPCGETYRGTARFSTPETTAESTYLNNYAGSWAAYVDIHSYGGYFLSSWGSTTTLPTDFTTMRSYMDSGVAAIRAVNGRTYASGSTARTLYIASGGSNDWTYGDHGVVCSFTIECYGTNFTPPVSQILPIGREVWAGVRALAHRLRTQ